MDTSGSVWYGEHMLGKIRRGRERILTWLEREGRISCVMNSVVLRLRESERTSRKSLVSWLGSRESMILCTSMNIIPIILSISINDGDNTS
jgi:hypothetical protein